MSVVHANARAPSRRQTTPSARRVRALPPSPALPTASVRRCPCAGDCPRCAGPSLGPGRAAPAAVRRRVEVSLGADLSAVRIHTDPDAHAFARVQGARAVTVGNDVLFARDQYAPGTAAGERRIAHELAHVVQQRRGAVPPRAANERYAAAEREGMRAAEAALVGRPARVDERTGGMPQRQDAREGSSPRAVSSGGFQLLPPFGFSPPLVQPALLDPTLMLDPELRRGMMRLYLNWWIGSGLTIGAPAVPPLFAIPGGLGGMAAPGRGERSFPPEFFRPIGADVLGPDVGAVLAPYAARGVPLGARDVDAAMRIRDRSLWWAGLMPDLRDMAPLFLRPLIPSDWRLRMAGAFSAATLDAQLRHDYRTPIEVGDQTWRAFTGASTVHLPGLSWSF